MSIDNVQLKREEVVGSEIVLEDIHPKTSSGSVTDSSTGASMDVTLDRLWNAINKKLSRIVNSVNGRTGVVVLNSRDVGLGNVDNVSFADIKQWVINKLKTEFGNKRLKLFSNLSELQELVDSNDEIYRDTPFFSEAGFDDDKRAYIGYIWMDEGKKELTYDCKPINTIGYTDNSIIYNEKLDDSRDFTGGGMSVNIWKYEDALELYNGMSKEDSGLRIDKSKIVGDLYHFSGVYGTGQQDDESALLYFTRDIPETELTTEVKIYIDDSQVIYNSIRLRQVFKKGDMIICDFEDYRDMVGNIPNGMCPSLMFRNPCIGKVENAPTTDTPDDAYIIRFYSLKPVAGWGLHYVKNHHEGVKDSQLSIKLADGNLKINNINNILNFSGLQVQAGVNDGDIYNFESTSIKDSSSTLTVLPTGRAMVFNETSGGLHITPDMSLCIMPSKLFGKGSSTDGNKFKSKYVDNWTSHSYIETEYDNDSRGVSNDFSLLGINLNKAIKTNTEGEHPVSFANISGLRITGYNEATELMTREYLGIDTDDETVIPTSTVTSGGLSVNVGKFLEISPGEYQDSSKTYYDGGKVNVRVGNSLCDSGNNRIEVNLGISPGGLYIDPNAGLRINLRNPSGLEFDKENANGALFIALAKLGGLKYFGDISDQDGISIGNKSIGVNARALTIKDSTGKTVKYHPLADNDGVDEITLGPGLKLSD